MARGTHETRPSEPGAGGRVDTSTLAKMTASINPDPASGAFRGPTAKVISAQFMGFDVRGNKVYKVAVQSAGGTSFMVRTWNGSNFSKAAKMRGTTSTPSGAPGSGSSAGDGGPGADTALAHAQQRWAMNIANSSTLSPGRKKWLGEQLQAYTGDAAGLDRMMDELFNKSISLDGTLPDVDPGAEFDVNDFLGGFGGGGGGGGGGFAGPQYVAPDKRVVEDTVKGGLVSLLGNIPDDAMVEQFTQLYMTDHRRNFDNEGENIDPNQSVIEAIRETENYKVLHELRPDSEDERAWVANRRQAAQQGGLDTGQQEDFAITQATVGGDLDDVRDAAAVRQTKRSGSTRGTSMEQRMRDTARKMMSGVV